MTLFLRLALPLSTTLYTQHIVLGHIALTFEPVCRLAGAHLGLLVSSLHLVEDVCVPASSL